MTPIKSIESQYKPWEELADDTWLRLVITRDPANSCYVSLQKHNQVNIEKTEQLHSGNIGGLSRDRVGQYFNSIFFCSSVCPNET